MGTPPASVGDAADARQRRGHWWIERVVASLGAIASAEANPLRHLESLAIALLGVAVVTGTYLFVLYPLSPWQAHRVVSAWSEHWLHGLMRSLHRYSSDMLVLVVLLHGLQMALAGKFRRWVEWVTGIGLVGVLWVIGISGLILIWDEQAQLLGLLVVRLLLGTGLFDPGLARMFVLQHPEELGGFFRVMLFGHVALSLLVIGGVWLHTVRLTRPRLLPPPRVALWSAGLLVAMAVAFPVGSGKALGSHIVPQEAVLDLWYGIGLLLLRLLSPAVVWGILGAVGAGLLLLPWLFRERRAVPIVDRDRCDACQQCVLDCPYGAMTLREWQGKMVAEPLPARCVGCGICMASCPEHGIVVPGVPQLPKEGSAAVLVVVCSGMPVPSEFQRSPYALVRVPCVGDVHADWVQERAGVVALVHCQQCYYRLGAQWARLRFAGRRRPRLRTGRTRVRVTAHSPWVWTHLRKWVASVMEQIPHAAEATVANRR